MTTEMQKLLTERVEKANRLNQQILDKAGECERILESLRKDASGGFGPRYHGHLLAAVLQLNETAIRLAALSE